MAKAKKEDQTAPVPGFYFMLSIQTDDGTDLGDLLCFEVNGQTTSLKIKEDEKSGKLLAEDMTLQDLTIKKPLKSGKNELEKKLTENMNLRYASNVAPKYVLILIAMDKNKEPKRIWNFQKAFPIKYATTGFNSTGSNFLMEEITFKYEKVIIEI